MVKMPIQLNIYIVWTFSNESIVLAEWGLSIDGIGGLWLSGSNFIEIAPKILMPVGFNIPTLNMLHILFNLTC